ncbi:MAG: hypothetical protein HC834_06535 [Rhodospirillales bacterium]|nr:hypothetical protein [Rhodospirillales bacterium]
MRQFDLQGHVSDTATGMTWRPQVRLGFAALLVTMVLSPIASAQQGTIQPIDEERIIALTRSDWNGDGVSDEARLRQSKAEPDSADLLIFLSDSANGELRLVLEKPGLVWQGAMAGTKPSLSINPRARCRSIPATTRSAAAAGRND